ncbi:MAG: hypothetical protein V1839_00775 [archaeon]
MSIKIKKTGKRGQEEIVGFVLIVVLVAIIFLIFLGITLRQKSPINQKESKDVSQFLESAMEYTTECAVGSEPDYSNLGRLVKDCQSRAVCKPSGREACDILKETVSNIIESSWNIGPESPNKGYIFNATYKSDYANEDVILISKGTCSVNLIGGDYFVPAFSGTIINSLTICL